MVKLSALILAKGSSRRLPGKNKLDFNGEPMFAVNVKKCLEIFDNVYVSSDDPDILEYAQKLGAIPIYRDSSLCGDTPNIPVYRHAIEFMEGDGIVAVQSNSPTVNKNLIVLSKRIMEMGIQELITVDKERNIYGSIWALTFDRIREYKDFYHPTPDVMIVDDSVDVHTKEDYEKALWQLTQA